MLKDAALSLIRRIYEAKGQTIEPALHNAFAQLNTINSTRNDLVHYGVSLDGGDLVVSTKDIAHVPSRARSSVVDVAELHAMLADLQTVEVILAAVQLKDAGQLDDSHLVQLTAGTEPDAWHYKPRAPAPSRQKTRDSSRSPTPSRPK